jgi:DNA-binding NarL/FixJ family response regulator
MVQAIDVGMVGERMLIEGFCAWSAADARGLRLVAAAPTIDEFLPKARRARPTVVVLDVLLHDRSDAAVNVGALTRERYRVVVVSTETWSRRIAVAMAAGARGHVTKHQGLRTLADAVRVVAAGGFAGTERPLVPEAAEGPARRPRLSAREWAVLRAYTSGLTLEAAARRVGIRPATAKTYLARVKLKYEEIGRPAYTKLELATRLREDCSAADDWPGHETGRDPSPAIP